MLCMRGLGGVPIFLFCAFSKDSNVLLSAVPKDNKKDNNSNMIIPPVYYLNFKYSAFLSHNSKNHKI